jgi:hypothetical protein
MEKKMTEYKFNGSETMNDLLDLADKGIISRNDINVYSEKYIDYIDAQIIYLGVDEAFHTQEEFDSLTVAQKNMVRARIDPVWAECNFGENYNLVFNKNRDLERHYEESA